MKIAILAVCYFFVGSAPIALAVWRELCTSAQPVIISTKKGLKRKKQ